MVAAAIQLLTGATLYAKNLFCPILAPGMSDRQIAKLAKIMVLLLTSGAVVLAIYSSMSLVSLWLLGSAGVAQLFPGVVLGLFSKRVTTAGVFAGLISGIAIALSLMLTGHDQTYYNLSPGFIALCFNFAVTGVVSLLTPVRIAGFETFSPLAASPSSDGVSLT
jgi:SSS family solute:Na+ symporter